MIFVPESIERTLLRITEAYKRDIKKGKSYYSSISKDGKTYTGTDTVRIQLEYFEAFKEKLENGTSELLICEKGKENEAKIRLMYAIGKFLEPLWQNDIYLIVNDVYIQRGLISRIKKLSTKSKTKKEALNLLEFINTAHYSSWGQDDENFEIRDFRLVDSEKDFDEILQKFKEAEELTARDLITDYTTIRVAWVPIDYITIYQKKGIYEEYLRFFSEHLNDSNFDDAIKMFNLWHDVRETAIYYIYAPKIEK